MTKITDYKLGSDPELFLKRRDTGEYFPAIGLIGGSKHDPKQMEGLAKGYTWQEDGVAVEYNVPPSGTKQEWINVHNTALKFIRQNISEEEFELALDASAEFNSEYLEMPGARIGGCETDNNVWLKEVNPKVDLLQTNTRSCGGHIAVSFKEGKDLILCEELVKSMDLFLGVPSVLIDSDKLRRSLYGKSGSFRFGTKYTGIEYRVLSNFWLKSQETLLWSWDNTILAIDFINAGKTIDAEDEEVIQNCINDSDMGAAQFLVDKYNIALPAINKVLV